MDDPLRETLAGGCFTVIRLFLFKKKRKTKKRKKCTKKVEQNRIKIKPFIRKYKKVFKSTLSKFTKSND